MCEVRTASNEISVGALRFSTEAEFIQAFQIAYGKHRADLDITQQEKEILKAFTHRYYNYVIYVARQAATLDPENAEEIETEIWFKVLNGVLNWRDQGFLFVTWIGTVARSAVSKYWKERGGVKVPHAMRQKMELLGATRLRLRGDLARNPSREELSAVLDWSVKEVQEIEEVVIMLKMEALDEPLEGEEDNHLTRAENVPAEGPMFRWAPTLEVRECLDQLPLNYKAALLLYGEDGYSYEEIASIMGVAVTTVNNWIPRAREKMRECLKDEEMPERSGDI